MAFTDQSALNVYKLLLTHQNFDAAAENSLLHENKQTGVTDFADIIKFDNTKGISGEVAATGSYKNLVIFDASDVVQLGEAGIEVHVPADPVSALGVCTKAYAEALQMFQTQPIVNQGDVAGGGVATVLNLTSVTRGILHGILMKADASAGTATLVITIDGVSAGIATIAPGANSYSWLTPSGLWTVGAAAVSGAGFANLGWRFNDTCNITLSSSSGTMTAYLSYSKIP